MRKPVRTVAAGVIVVLCAVVTDARAARGEGDKRSAAEFSFFLAMPTMAGAFVFDFYKNRDIIDGAQLGLVAIGFVCAFIAAVLVVRSLLDFVSRHGFGLFAWWRIIVGGVAIVALTAF